MIGRLPHAAESSSIALVRGAVVVTFLLVWEALALSGVLLRDVVPRLEAIAAALSRVLVDGDFYANLATTAGEVGVSLLIGGVAGVAVGLLLGASRLLGAAFEPYLHYLGPTPKIIFFPIMILWFGVGVGSKVAMGAISCFFPLALSVASGMRHIDPVLIRVGLSFGARPRHMVMKIYLPAIRQPLINGFRLGFGVSVIGVLLAETKLSNKGLGFMVIQSYAHFDIATMYALVMLLFALAIIVNALITRFGRVTAWSFDS